MRIVSVVGTRPQLIKAAALEPALRARFEAQLIDTGQHYDDALAGSFFRELGLGRPEHGLGIGGGTGADQTGRMMVALDPVLAGIRPDAVLV
ncbi:MAG TPA: UDP-N-acetylglucosamine 2-epimerase, partial [Candidatus Limnocylindrales bacterium]|nr:UDP-N-acetylglucosamine 2-epimerase [Candidatus Limnocylindrales bacterium]